MTHLRPRLALLASIVTAAAAAPAARAEIRADQVLVVVNDSSAVSQSIGAYYASVRGIPPVQVLHLPAGTTTAEGIVRADYNTQVRDPIKAYLETTVPTLKNQIRCILLTKGVPLRVENSTGTPFSLTQSVASVDSELTQLFTGKVSDSGQNGWLTNPYFNSQVGFEQFAPAPHLGISYLVCRLDGYADQIDGATGVPVDIKNLIDRSQTPALGVYLLDGDPTKTGGYAAGETWMTTAKTQLQAAGLTVVHDQTTTFVSNQPNILGYASWGSNDANNLGVPYYGTIAGNSVPGAFLPGSIVTDYVSTSARSFQYPPSYGQSMTADLIRWGACAVNGHVYEPFLDACSQPDKVFVNYARGFTAAEALYTSIKFLSWENVVVCDPLMKRMQVVSSVISLFPQTLPQAGGNASIGGTNFSTLADTTVTVDGVPAVVTGVSKGAVQFVSPPGGPGPRTVVMTNSSGSFQVPVKLLYTPAITTSQPTPAINGPWTFTLYGMHVQDVWGVFAGTAAASPLPVPPFGDFLLDFNLPVVDVISGTMPFLQSLQAVTLQVPNDPMLQGVTYDLQAIVGGGPSAPTDFKLTNLTSITIQ